MEERAVPRSGTCTRSIQPTLLSLCGCKGNGPKIDEGVSSRTRRFLHPIRIFSLIGVVVGTEPRVDGVVHQEQEEILQSTRYTLN